jgi:hypothetical protein
MMIVRCPPAGCWAPGPRSAAARSRHPARPRPIAGAGAAGGPARPPGSAPALWWWPL